MLIKPLSPTGRTTRNSMRYLPLVGTANTPTVRVLNSLQLAVDCRVNKMTAPSSLSPDRPAICDTYLRPQSAIAPSPLVSLIAFYAKTYQCFASAQVIGTEYLEVVPSDSRLNAPSARSVATLSASVPGRANSGFRHCGHAASPAE